jgi:hypothetical protein
LSQHQRKLLLAQLEMAQRLQVQKLRELQEQTQRMEADRSQIKQTVDDLRHLSLLLNASLKTAYDLLKRTGEGQPFIGKVEKLAANIQSVITKAEVDTANPSQAEAMKNQIAEYFSMVNRHTSAIMEEAEQIKDLLYTSLHTDVDRAFDSINKANASAKDIRSDQLSSLGEDIMLRLRALEKQVLTPLLSKKVSTAISTVSEITSESFFRNFLALTVVPLEEECGKYMEFRRANYEHYMELCTRYAVLCDSLGIKSRKYEFATEVLTELENAIRDMEHRVTKAAEESYIADAVDEVMIEMGYAVLGSKEVNKSSGRRFRSELYSFDDGTAINVTFSSDGRITMELGGLSDEDRQPTPYETARLCDDMEQFCSDYRDIERRLEQRGVVLSERIALLPPDERYAQIINVADYELVHEVELIQSARSRAQKEKTEREVDS